MSALPKTAGLVYALGRGKIMFDYFRYMNTVINIKNITSQMTPELESLLSSVEYDIARGKNISKMVSFSDEMKNYLCNLYF